MTWLREGSPATAPGAAPLPLRSVVGQDRFALQRLVGNRAVAALLAPGPSALPARSAHVGDKVTDEELQDDTDDGEVVAQDKDGGAAGVIADDAGSAAPGAKSAGVDAFSVKWASTGSEKKATLHVDYAAKFTSDGSHDPALANFRQNAFHKYEITAGPHKGTKSDNSPLHDDSYTRADDHQHSLSDQDFVSTDNPGVRHLSADDVIDYTFSAEEMIIDTSAGNKVIAKRGPHTATIKGKHPRTVDGVPATLA